MKTTIIPEWPAPSHIHAFCTTRLGGVSEGPYQSFNLATHVEDNSSCVNANRLALMQELDCPSTPVWLEQIHGNTIVELTGEPLTDKARQADASYTRQEGVVCAVLTADCLPLLVSDRLGMQVAAIHCGWRGLLNGVIESALLTFQNPQELLVWLGPAISQQHFEVGKEIYAQAVARYSWAEAEFVTNSKGRYQMSVNGIARGILSRLGVTRVYGGDFCTYEQEDWFYSYRRDGACGRMASLIWIAPRD